MGRFEVHTSRQIVSVWCVEAPDALTAATIALRQNGKPADRYVAGEPTLEFAVALDPDGQGMVPQKPWAAPTLRPVGFRPPRSCHRHRLRKLTEQQHATITRRLRQPDCNLTQLAEQYGVSRPLLSRWRQEVRAGRFG